jgi:hypothetical protein
MTADRPMESPRGDKMTTDFLEDVLLAYLEEDRIESGVLRLDLEDGRTRRIVVDDETASLDPYEYVLRELAEVIALIDENEDLLEEPVNLTIPVGDTEQVVEEATEDGTVTTLFRPEGITTVLEHLQASLGSVHEGAPAEE